MNGGDTTRKLNEITKQTLAMCETREEAKELLADEDGRELDDELLDAIVGGWSAHWEPGNMYPQGSKPAVIS